MKNKFTVFGAAALVAAFALFGASLQAAGAAVAQVAEPTASVSASATVCGGLGPASIRSLGNTGGTCTPVSAVHTSTPTASPTSAATNTPAPVATTAPATVVPPANTAVPATATSPSGGQLGAVSAPNTGTGDGTAGGGFPWMVLAGMALAVAGIGSIGYGVRRR